MSWSFKRGSVSRESYMMFIKLPFERKSSHRRKHFSRPVWSVHNQHVCFWTLHKGLLVELCNPTQTPDYSFLSLRLWKAACLDVATCYFFDATDQVTNIMADWFVLKHHQTCWPDSPSTCGCFSTLSQSLDPWPAKRVVLRPKGATTTWRTGERSDRKKVIQRKRR